MIGRPVPVVISKEDHTFELDEIALKKVLMRTDVKDTNIVVISVAGAFRKGKSFLLDFFLRYLNSDGSPDWMGDDCSPLEGFSWRGGSERDTTGILLWSEAFLRKLPNGEYVSVLLMDTQGAFDSESTVRDCATVFALSTLLSSVQIFNLLHNIQEDDLQHLQLFTEYGRMALESCSSKPFQKLLFLVRDWSFPYEAEYGAKGGGLILNRRLKISDKQHPELQALREHIRACFSNIACFLMPHPGLKVATNPDFNGKLSDIECDFKDYLKILVPLLLAPENLVVKEICGQKVRGMELLQYFKSYMDIYKSDEIPEPKSILVATAEGNNLAALAAAKYLYKSQMEKICGGAQPYVNTEQMDAEHNRSKNNAIQAFSNKRKMGGEEFAQKYLEELVNDIEEMYSHFLTYNESKNIFRSVQTPFVLIFMTFVLYFLSDVFSFLGISSLGHLCSVLISVGVVCIIVWLYCRYSGEMRELGVQIDELSDYLWKNLMKPVYQTCLQTGVKYTVQKAPLTAVEDITEKCGKIKTS
ncbi:atlastin-like [Anabrus simplex]|uniref:atlastin-like n=1 Tax=Anabrus simplex TaxID=316456 RepID=UPI0034DD391E